MYLHLTNRSETPKLLQNLFDRILEHEKEDPTLKIKIPSEMPFEESLPILRASERIKNYSRKCTEIPRDFFDGAHMSNFVPQCCKDLEYVFSISIKNYDLPIDAG